MVSIPLGKSDYRRGVAHEAEIPVLNRYFETNPSNLEDQVALLSRPGLRRFVTVGEGPIRKIYSQPGSFEDALFVVSGEELYRVDTDDTVTFIADGIAGADTNSTPSMCATARLGPEGPFEYLYLADGVVLWRYVEAGNARGALTTSGAIANGYKIQVGTVYYQWTSGSVDTGTPDGTTANPWLVDYAAGVNALAMDNMRRAINASGTEGTDYSTGLTANPDAIATSSSALTLRLQAIAEGIAGNTVPTVVVSGANIAFGAATLADGGTPGIFQVPVPDDVGVISVGYVAGYVVLVVAQGYGVNGRFYWIDPGDTTIDPLNFATAERSPDPVLAVRVVGDQFWLLGTNSVEIWYPSGDATAPMQRTQGRLFDRGIWEGTDAAIKDSVLLVDNDGGVYQITGGGPRRVSNSSIEELIRKAIAFEAMHTF